MRRVLWYFLPVQKVHNNNDKKRIYDRMLIVKDSAKKTFTSNNPQTFAGDPRFVRLVSMSRLWLFIFQLGGKGTVDCVFCSLQRVCTLYFATVLAFFTTNALILPFQTAFIPSFFSPCCRRLTFAVAKHKKNGFCAEKCVCIR